MRLACEKENVRSLGAHTLESFRSAGDRLVDDDRFHERVVGKRDHVGDERLLL